MTIRSAHILLCDPNPSSAHAIESYLVAQGCKVSRAQTGGQIERMAMSDAGDLVILDVAISDTDPLAVARRLSERQRLGLLMLTESADPVERICSLEAGADDCLSKPCEMRELLARTKAILRRLTKADGPMPPVAPDGQSTVRFGACQLDIDGRRLRAPCGADMTITEMELSLLKAFLAHPNQALNRDEIAEIAYGRTWTPFDRSLDIRISRLRRKIERDPARPEVILTVRGIGYRYETRPI
ncbi:MAG: winged helix-turn-helix domain-containing protein [Hyphomicrobiaceae bacterium]